MPRKSHGIENWYVQHGSYHSLVSITKTVQCSIWNDSCNSATIKLIIVRCEWYSSPPNAAAAAAAVCVFMSEWSSSRKPTSERFKPIQRINENALDSASIVVTAKWVYCLCVHWISILSDRERENMVQWGYWINILPTRASVLQFKFLSY